MDFISPTNELSNNTIALTSVIANLQQLIPSINIDTMKDDEFEKIPAYIQLRKFHLESLSRNKDTNQDQDLYFLGNIICAFLNFCRDTLDSKAAYQQILLVILGLLQHLFNIKGG